MQGSIAGVAPIARDDEDSSQVCVTRTLSQSYATELPIIEISDEDYRSFCMPCDTLEDDREKDRDRDCKPAG